MRYIANKNLSNVKTIGVSDRGTIRENKLQFPVLNILSYKACTLKNVSRSMVHLLTICNP